MASQRVPIVLVPRFNTFASTGTFPTVGLDVTDFSSAVISVWRGNVLGTAGGFGITFQESSDQEQWSTCSGTNPDMDPGAFDEHTYSFDLQREFFRARVKLTGTAPVVTCYAAGFLLMRAEQG